MKIAGAALLVSGIVLGSAVTGRSSEPAARGTIAYLSVQRILTAATDAKTANTRLETLRQEKAREVTAKRKELEATHLELLQNGGVFRGTQRAKLQADEDRQRAELQQLTEQATTDVQNLQRQVQDELRKKMSTVLADISKRRKMELVLNLDTAVLWAVPGYDLTPEVLEKLNAVATPPPAPAK